MSLWLWAFVPIVFPCHSHCVKLVTLARKCDASALAPETAFPLVSGMPCAYFFVTRQAPSPRTIWISKMNAPGRVTVENVSVEELKQGLADGTILLVDVREPNEFAAGRIPGSTLNPLQTFDPAALPKAEGKRVVLSCRSGNRSLRALALAQAAGRTDVTAHYPGGMIGWRAAGEPVEM